MSGSSDDRAAKRQRQQALALQPGEGGLWDPTDLQFMTDQGVGIQSGARFRAPTSARELASWGFAGGGAGPDPMIGLDEWLRKNNMSLQQFQEQYGGLPLVFNEDGTATYDPSAQRQSFSYNNPDDGTFHKIAPLMFAAIAAGPQITNFLSGMSGAGAAAGGAMDMGVGLGGELGAWGGITPIAEGASAGIGTGAGSFLQDIPMNGVSNALEIPGGTGPVDPNFTSLTDLTGGVTPVNTNLGAGGFNSIDQMIGQISSGGTATTGSVGAGAGALASGLDLAAANGVAGTSGGIISQISKALGIPIDKVMEKATTDPILKTLIDGYGIWSQGKTNDEVMNIIRQGMTQSDPFASQRGFYQDRLKQSYTDPNFFQNDPTFRGIRDMAVNDVGRAAAARGYNNSSNVLHEIGSRIGQEGTKYALGYQNQLGQLAGGGISPAGIAQLSTQGANLAQQQGEQQAGNWGSFIRELPKTLQSVDKLTSGFSSLA